MTEVLQKRDQNKPLSISQATILQETLILKTDFLAYIFYPIMAGNGLSCSPAGRCFGSFLWGAVSRWEEARLHGWILEQGWKPLLLQNALGVLHKNPPQLLDAQLEGCGQDIGHPGSCAMERRYPAIPGEEQAPCCALCLCPGHKQAEQKSCLSSKLMGTYFYETW